MPLLHARLRWAFRTASSAPRRAGATLAVVIASFMSLHRTRHIYLSLATFHAYLELACLAFLWMRRQGGMPEPARQVDGLAR